MGNDPPGQFTRVLHPRVGRHGEPPANVIPVGRSVIVPANGSLPNIVLSPRSYFRIVRALERERFDVLHLHEPMTPTICLTTLIRARCPLVATFHASGELGWMRGREAALGLSDRPDRPPHRRLRAREGVAESLATRRLRGDSERRARPAVGAGRRAASTASSSPVARSRARGCRSCSAPGRRSTGARGSGSRSPAPIRSPSACSSRVCAFSDDGIDVVGFLEPGGADRRRCCARRRSSRRRSARRASAWC